MPTIGVSEVIDMHVHFADLQAKFLFPGCTIGYMTTQHVLTQGRVTSPEIAGCDLEIVFQQQLQSLMELETRHILILPGISW